MRGSGGSWGGGGSGGGVDIKVAHGEIAASPQRLISNKTEDLPHSGIQPRISRLPPEAARNRSIRKTGHEGLSGSSLIMRMSMEMSQWGRPTLCSFEVRHFIFGSYGNRPRLLATVGTSFPNSSLATRNSTAPWVGKLVATSPDIVVVVTLHTRVRLQDAAGDYLRTPS
jgi:hypothetical protein